MSYMKDLWIRMEQAKADRELDLWEHFQDFEKRYAKIEALYSAYGKVGPPPGGAMSHLTKSASPSAAITVREVVVILVCSGYGFECRIMVSPDPSGVMPNTNRLRQIAEATYGDVMRKYACFRGQMALPGGIKCTVSPAQTTTAIKVPTLDLEDCEEAFADIPRYNRTIYEHPPFESAVTKPLIEEPTCEADKPIGTRDPDKFLKEQQNKLWQNEP